MQMQIGDKWGGRGRCEFFSLSSVFFRTSFNCVNEGARLFESCMYFSMVLEITEQKHLRILQERPHLISLRY